MTPDLRTKLENKSIELLQQTYPFKETIINVVSIGPGGLYQELVYLAKLAKAGYKQIRLIAIDPAPIFIGALDFSCEQFIPAKITIEQFSSLDDFIEKSNQDSTLLPDLLLLIDLTDDKYKTHDQLLSNYSFDQLFQHNLLKNNTVISYSTLEMLYTRDVDGKVIRLDFIPKIFSGVFTPTAKDLSSISTISIGEGKPVRVDTKVRKSLVS